MNRFFGKLAKAAMIAAVLCLVAGGALAKDPERPLRGRGEVTRVSVGECDPGVVGILPPELYEGTVIATHEGRSKISACTVVTEVLDPVAIVKVEGKAVITTANGDETYSIYSGALNFSSNPCRWTITNIVVGGTGRFEGASGLFQTTGIQPWSAPFTCGPESSIESRGTITY